jgi:DNA-directed RNA polymerase III subunit RPC7
MDVPIPRKPTSNEIQQWKLRKEYLGMIRDSPFHLTAPPPPPDIERYSDKYKVIAAKRSLRDIETSKAFIFEIYYKYVILTFKLDLDFFPEELQPVIDPKRGKKSKYIWLF